MKITLSTILSIIPALAILLFGIFYVTGVISLGDMPDLIRVLNFPSLAIIIGGLLTVELISFPPKQVFDANVIWAWIVAALLAPPGEENHQLSPSECRERTAGA
jgi:flagellar motor component MotA